LTNEQSNEVDLLGYLIYAVRSVISKRKTTVFNLINKEIMHHLKGHCSKTGTPKDMVGVPVVKLLSHGVSATYGLPFKMATLNGIWTFPPLTFPLRTYSHGRFPRPDISPSLFTWCRTSPLPPPPCANLYKADSVNVYKIDSG